MTWITALLRNGKTIAGGILTVASTIGMALSPDDIALVQSLLHGSNTVGQIILAVGLLDKLRKAVQARQAGGENSR